MNIKSRADLKGVAKIELFNESGDTVTTEIDENITTHLNKKMTEWVIENLKYCNDNFILDDNGKMIIDRMNAIKGSNSLKFDPSEIGVSLLTHKLTENPLLMTYNQKPLAIANGLTVTDNPMNGVLNKSESKDILNEDNEIIGYRFVWDFGTHAANGDINCICLSSSRLGANNSSEYSITNTSEYFYKNPPLYHGNTCYTLDPAFPRFIVENSNKNGFNFYSGNTVKIGADNISYNQDYSDFLTDVNSFNVNKRKYKMILDNINNKIITINIESSNEFSILTYNLDTKTLISKKAIRTDDKFTDNIRDFGMLGEKYILVIKGDGRELNTLYYFDYTSDEQVATKIDLENIVTSYSSHLKELPTYAAADGGYSCSVIYNSDNYHPYHVRTAELYIDKENDDNIVPLFYRKLDNETSTSLASPVYVYPFGLLVTCGFGNGTDKRLKYSLGVSSRAIYSINNLENTVTKTESNTMKITYDITWA